MRRDRLTFAMMFGIPIIQLILFGFAINYGSEESACGGARLGQQPVRAQVCPRHGKQRLLQDRRSCRDRGSRTTSAGSRRGAICSELAPGLLAPARSRRQTGDARAGRRHRSFRGQLRRAGHQRNRALGFRSRPGRTVAKSRRPSPGRSSCEFTSNTIPIASLNTTSFPV